ncbi:MAG: polysaccharide lyase 6 family protein [Planctomycetota bacterium]
MSAPSPRHVRFRIGRTIQCLCAIALFAWTDLACPHVFAEERWISPETDLKSLLKKVKPGDTLVLANGTWSDKDLRFEQLPGTADAPITLRAESPGKVILTGAIQFRVSGRHVTVSGLTFRNPSGASNVFEFRTHSERLAHHCRITDCRFEQTQDGDSKDSRWLNVYGTNNRVDHCYFAGKRNRGTTLVVWVHDQPGRHRIDHNRFGPRPELGKNGGETIRIGTSETSTLDCFTVVEQNYFDRCNGEGEVISNKSCGNVYRHNLFERCEGALTLRHGNRCVVDGNVFLGHGVGRTGGVRIIGEQHRVTNNYFEGLRGDAERAGVCFMNGLSDGPLNGYAPVRGAVVAYNTFLDCKVSMEFGVKLKENPVAPSLCRINHNVFRPGKWELFRVEQEPVEFTWLHNKYQAGKTRGAELVSIDRVDIELTRAADGLLRPTEVGSLAVVEDLDITLDIDGHPRNARIAGCDDPTNAFVDRQLTRIVGPSWMKLDSPTPVSSGL